MDVYLHRGPWAPPGRLERIESPPRAIAPGPYAGRGAEAPHHTAMVEELVAAVEAGPGAPQQRARRALGAGDDHGRLRVHRRGGARVPLPLAHRGHPLQRWIDDTGAPQPVKPEPRVKVLTPAPGVRA